MGSTYVIDSPLKALLGVLIFLQVVFGKVLEGMDIVYKIGQPIFICLP